jgi:hypothetical protein
MAKPDTLLIDGHGYSWQQFYEQRGQALAADAFLMVL